MASATTLMASQVSSDVGTIWLFKRKTQNSIRGKWPISATEITWRVIRNRIGLRRVTRWCTSTWYRHRPWPSHRCRQRPRLSESWNQQTKQSRCGENGSGTNTFFLIIQRLQAVTGNKSSISRQITAIVAPVTTFIYANQTSAWLIFIEISTFPSIGANLGKCWCSTEFLFNTKPK